MVSGKQPVRMIVTFTVRTPDQITLALAAVDGLLDRLRRVDPLAAVRIETEQES